MVCGQSPDWFTKAYNGDTTYVTKQLNKRKGSYDSRETNGEQNIFNGFAAIHYAVYNNQLDVLKLLMKDEFQLDTKADTNVVAPGFSPVTRYKLAAGSNILALALLRKHDQVCQYIMQYLAENEEAARLFVGKMNQMGLTTYIVATLVQSPEAYEVLRNPLYLQREFGLVLKGDITPIMNAAYFGRLETAKVLFELSEQDAYKEVVFEMALQRDNSKKTAIELSLDDKVDLAKFDTTAEKRRDVQQIVFEIVKRAYIYAVTSSDAKWQVAVKGFLMDQSENDVFGQNVLASQGGLDH